MLGRRHLAESVGSGGSLAQHREVERRFPVSAVDGFASAAFVVGGGSFVMGEDARPERPALRHRAEWERRIEDLRSWAAEDGEPFRSESERDFWTFVEATPGVRRGGLVLAPRGNLRAVWQDDAGARVALQFLGGGIVLYVIFGPRPRTPDSRVSGHDDFEGIQHRIDGFGLHSFGVRVTGFRFRATILWE